MSALPPVPPGGRCICGAARDAPLASGMGSRRFLANHPHLPAPERTADPTGSGSRGHATRRPRRAATGPVREAAPRSEGGDTLPALAGGDGVRGPLHATSLRSRTRTIQFGTGSVLFCTRLPRLRRDMGAPRCNVGTARCRVRPPLQAFNPRNPRPGKRAENPAMCVAQ